MLKDSRVAGGWLWLSIFVALSCAPGGGCGGSSKTLASSISLLANAGPDQTVTNGMLVVLDGASSSVPLDGNTSYVWAQISGPFVELLDANSLRPRFTAPNITVQSQELSFELLISRPDLNASDQVKVTVVPDYGIGLPYLLWYDMRPHSHQRTQMDELVEELIALGFTHVTLQSPFAQRPDWVQSYRDRGMKIAMMINLRTILDGFGVVQEPLAYHQVNRSILPGCVDENPNSPCPLDTAANLCPNYTGALWDNTLTEIRETVTSIQPEIVLVDGEFFRPYSTAGYTIPGVIDACSRCQGKSGYDAARRARGEAIVDEIIAIVPDAKVLLHDTFNPNGNTYCYRAQNADDGAVLYGRGDDGWWPAGIRSQHTIPSPEHYALSDLSLIQCNTSHINLQDTVPAISFHWSRAGYYSWDPSQTFTAARLYKSAGVQGLVIWPSWFGYLNNESELAVWMAHARALVAGLRSVP